MICEPCLLTREDQRARHRPYGRGCTGCPLAALPPRLRELNARMVEAGLVSASAPQAKRVEFERGEP